MGRRTLTAWQLSFHEKHVRKGHSVAPADVDGKDLLDIFEDWTQGLTSDVMKDERRQSWLSVTKVDRVAPRAILVEMNVGSYGEPGDVVDAATGDHVFTVTGDHAPTGQVRSVLMVPPHGLDAYYLAEYSVRGTGGSRMLALFRTHFSKFSSTVTMDTEGVTESEAWSDSAALREVEVRIKGRSADIADSPQVRVGTLSHIARAERGRHFPRGLLSRIGTDRQIVGRVVGIPEVDADADVFVTMELDGRQKKFLLGNAGAPTLRQILNEATEPPLSIDDLIQVCTERVSDLAARTGSQWNPGWSTT